ncbi:hypothetical protein B0H14DRAFT_2998836 [Mycena olivaceomarginata]|nr:hypothetical protein B0H14DRAFT_2998836 [Mycena olivaceomarginata]
MLHKTVRAAAHSLRNITPPSASAPASRTASTLPPFDVPGRQQLDHVEQPSQPGLTSPRRALKLSPPTLVYEGPSHRRPIILNHHEPTPYRTGPTAGTMTIFEGPTHPGRQCQRPGVHSGENGCADTHLPALDSLRAAGSTPMGSLVPVVPISDAYFTLLSLAAHILL